MRHAVLSLSLLVLGATAAQAACTGQCVTKEYRIDESYDFWDVIYERNDHTYWVDDVTIKYYVPAQPTVHEVTGGGTPLPQERGVVQAMLNQAREAAANGRAIVNARYAEITADAGTTNTCSTGCECAEGSFTETPDSLWCGSSEFRERTVEGNGRAIGYVAMWMGSATIEFTRRTKTVGCIALEP